MLCCVVLYFIVLCCSWLDQSRDTINELVNRSIDDSVVVCCCCCFGVDRQTVSVSYFGFDGVFGLLLYYFIVSGILAADDVVCFLYTVATQLYEYSVVSHQLIIIWIWCFSVRVLIYFWWWSLTSTSMYERRKCVMTHHESRIPQRKVVWWRNLAKLPCWFNRRVIQKAMDTKDLFHIIKTVWECSLWKSRRARHTRSKRSWYRR